MQSRTKHSISSYGGNMRILILGASGMLGHVIALRLYSRGYNIVGLSKKRKIMDDTILLDAANRDCLEQFLNKSYFDVIINCIALLVNTSEKNRSTAIYLNAYLPHYLEDKYKNTKTRIIHISTDGVFSGKKGQYLEGQMHDTPTFYGKTKSLGEINNKKDLTIRGSFIGPDISSEGEGLLNWFFKQDGEVRGYDKVIFNGVTSLECASFIEQVIERPLTGIYHLGAPEYISKGDLLRRIKKVFELNHVYIVQDSQIISNHTIVNTRSDINYTVNNYDTMLMQLRKWIFQNKELYNHYTFLE